MNENIVIIEKPDYVSYDEIHKVLWAAHETTRAQGMNFDTAVMSGDELRNYIEKHGGTCFVAMDGDRVVGTDSCFIVNVNKGAIQGDFAKSVLVGILPDYKGHHLFSRFFDVEVRYAKDSGADGILSTTFADNTKVRQIREKQGFIYTRYFYRKNHFSVGGYLCFDELPHGRRYYKFVFITEKIKAYIKRWLTSILNNK